MNATELTVSGFRRFALRTLTGEASSETGAAIGAAWEDLLFEKYSTGRLYLWVAGATEYHDFNDQIMTVLAELFDGLVPLDIHIVTGGINGFAMQDSMRAHAAACLRHGKKLDQLAIMLNRPGQESTGYPGPARISKATTCPISHVNMLACMADAMLILPPGCGTLHEAGCRILWDKLLGLGLDGPPWSGAVLLDAAVPEAPQSQDWLTHFGAAAVAAGTAKLDHLCNLRVVNTNASGAAPTALNLLRRMFEAQQRLRDDIEPAMLEAIAQFRRRKCL